MTEQKTPEEIAEYIIDKHSVLDKKTNPNTIKAIAKAIKAERRATRNTCENCRKDAYVNKDEQNHIHESTSNVVEESKKNNHDRFYLSCDPQKAWNKNKDLIKQIIRPRNNKSQK